MDRRTTEEVLNDMNNDPNRGQRIVEQKMGVVMLWVGACPQESRISALYNHILVELQHALEEVEYAVTHREEDGSLARELWWTSQALIWSGVLSNTLALSLHEAHDVVQALRHHIATKKEQN